MIQSAQSLKDHSRKYKLHITTFLLLFHHDGEASTWFELLGKFFDTWYFQIRAQIEEILEYQNCGIK